MSAHMHRVLHACARRFPVAVITGRALEDVKKRVRVRGVSFAGNHGLEWSVRGERSVVAVASRPQRALMSVKKSLGAIAVRYRGAFIEDKRYSLAVHYRHVRALRRNAFVQAVQDIVHTIGGRHLRAVPGILILNILPNIGWNKGTAARMMHARLRRSKTSVPLFIGDDATDEDAFRALPIGITVHVGRSAKSAARFYLHSQHEVAKFLVWLTRVQN